MRPRNARILPRISYQYGIRSRFLRRFFLRSRIRIYAYRVLCIRSPSLSVSIRTAPVLPGGRGTKIITHSYMEPILFLARWLVSAEFAGAGLVTCIAGACCALMLQRPGGRTDVIARQAGGPDELHSAPETTATQNGLLVVCAWTKRIKAGDQWLTPEEFLTRQLGYRLTHGISPEGVRLAENGRYETMPPVKSASRKLVTA